MTGSPRIIRAYVLREILGTTFLSTLVLTVILLYGNLSKHDEDLFRALSLSPVLFLELISLMIPFAVSLGLPFGFSLAVIFCVGRWSADREILAMQSLGIRRTVWATPILVSSLMISTVGCFASLHWSPVSRGAFESRIRDMAWQDFQTWVQDRREIPFKIDNTEGQSLMGGLDSTLNQNISQATLSIGHGEEDEWKNVRILMWGENRDLLAILHAKKSTVIKDFEKGTIELFLHDVDYESLEKNEQDTAKNSNFISFKKWKHPMKFTVDSQNVVRDMKRLSLLEFLELKQKKELADVETVRAYNHFNKYASICCAPLSLSPLLISVAVRRGRRETYANLFFGVLICLLYFALGTTLGQSIGSNGYGWWISNLFVSFFGVSMIIR